MNPKVREEFRRQKQIRIRLARASFRPEMAELERIWAIVSAHREGLSVRDIARQVGLGPTRVHQLVTSARSLRTVGHLPTLSAISISVERSRMEDRITDEKG
jgi:hypothetical protein